MFRAASHKAFFRYEIAEENNDFRLSMGIVFSLIQLLFF